MNYEISSTDQNHQEDLTPLLEQMYPRRRYPDLDLSRVTGEVRQEAETLLVHEEGKPVGLALVSFIDYGLYPYGVLQELIVDRGNRRSGIGQSLVEASCRWVADRGGLVLYVTAASGTAEDFYRSLGFERTTRPELSRVVSPLEIPVAPQRWA